jgi:hypothetical protein
MTVLLLCATVPNQLIAASANPTSINTTHPTEEAKAEVLISRLNAIKAMDKSELSSSEKKQLRKEVRSIRGELNTMGGEGIYLSVGAIIIIVLLLILLL